jgi:hypothetical protein
LQDGDAVESNKKKIYTSSNGKKKQKKTTDRKNNPNMHKNKKMKKKKDGNEKRRPKRRRDIRYPNNIGNTYSAKAAQYILHIYILYIVYGCSPLFRRRRHLFLLRV